MAQTTTDGCADLVLRDACSDSLATFGETMAPGYRAAPLHRHLARQLEAVYRGASPRLCISVPPRMGKSVTASVLFVAWCLTKNPRLNVILASHSADLAEGFSMSTRQILGSEVYLSLFPRILSPDLERSRNWQTLAGGSYFATGVGGGGLGRGADLLILDDLVKNREDAESETAREKTWGWLTSTALTRLSPGGAVIVIGSRWHEDDVIGRLTSTAFEGPKFTYDPLQAICENPDTDPLHRKAGESIWPERWTAERLGDIRATIGRREFASHYQQRPAPPGGNIVDIGKVRFIERQHVPDHLVQSRGWDLALGVQRVHDFSCGARGGLDREGNFILTDMNRSRRAWPEQKAMIVAFAKLEHGKIGIETAAAWKIAEEEVRTELDGAASVRGITPAKSKEARALPWLGLIEAGKFFVVRGGWNHDFLHELEQFPTGTHDDQVDAVSVLYEVVRKREMIYLA